MVIKLGPYQYAPIECVNIDWCSFEIMLLHNIHGFFELILHHTCMCINRLLREQGIDDGTSYLVLVGID